MTRLPPLLIIACVACLNVATNSSIGLAENWPNWRGPKNDGISPEKGLPAEWSKEKHISWKTPLPGPAGATPVVWGEHIFLTSVDSKSSGGDLLLLCFKTDGGELWRRVVSTGNHNVRGDEGNSASPSPVTDGQHVWTFMADGILACYDFKGELVWKEDIQKRYGKFSIQFGLTSTPVLDGDVLYQQLIHGEGNPKTREAKVIALEKATGKQVWAVDRPSDGRDENEHSYASPVLYDDGKSKFLLSHGADYIVAHSLADGHELWRCGELNRKAKYDATLRFVASPVVAPGLIVVPTAKQGPLVALKPGFQGDITEQKEAHWWNWNKTPDVPSPLIHDGFVYLGMHDGTLTVLDAVTGEQIYTKRVHPQRHRASPVFADGKLYLTGRDGKISVVKGGREFELLAQNELGEDQSASPAISNGTIYLRTSGHLWAVRQK